MSNQSATLVAEDGRTVTVTEGVPVVITPAEIVVDETPTVPSDPEPEAEVGVGEAKAEVAPEAAPEAEVPAEPAA